MTLNKLTWEEVPCLSLYILLSCYFWCFCLSISGKKTSGEFQATLDRTIRLQAECGFQLTKGPRLNSTRPTTLGPKSSMDLNVQRPNKMQHSARSRVRKRSLSGPTLYSTRASSMSAEFTHAYFGSESPPSNLTPSLVLLLLEDKQRAKFEGVDNTRF